MTRSVTVVGRLFVFGLLALAPTQASAQSRRAIVLDFDGPGSGAARGGVVSAIEDAGGWSVVGNGEVSRAAANIGADPNSREVAAELGASAVISGRVTKRGRVFRARITVRDASTGSSLGSETFSGRGAGALRSDIQRSFWDQMGSVMGRGHAPSAGRRSDASSTSSSGRRGRDEQEDDEQEREEDDSEDDRRLDRDDGDDDDYVSDDGQEDARPFWFAFGMVGFHRSFSYTDDIYYQLRPYELALGPAVRGQARWYPGAHVTRDFASNIGLEFSGSGAVGITTRQSDGSTYATDSVDIRAGADLRLPLGPAEIGIGISYGIHTFTLAPSDQDGFEAELPNVEYQYLRPAVRLHVDIASGVYGEGAFGWRVLTASGGLGNDWFPYSSGSGFDLGFHVGWESDIGLGARAGFEMQYYFFSMNSEPGDTHIAGGALDLYVTGTVELVWRPRM